MAFQTKRVVTFPLAETYRGPTAVIRFDFPFVFLPGIDPIAQLEAIVQAGLFSLSIIPEIRDNYLSYELAVDDKAGFTPDRYQVTVIVAGETEEASGTIGPFFAQHQSLRRGQVAAQAFIGIVPLLAIAVAIGILLIFAVIAYNIFTGRWGAAAFGWGVLLPLALVAGGVYLVSQGRKRTRERETVRRRIGARGG